MKSDKIKKITLVAILSAIAIIISYVDKLISSVAFAFLPMAKIGLANIVILISLYKFDFKSSLIIAILKSVLSNLLFGSFMSFIIGFSGTMLSFLGMYMFKKLLTEKISVISVSALGGTLHIMGQCIVIYFVYNLGSEITLYLGYLILVSLITSVLVGFIAKRIIEYKTSQL